jgi:HEAT repeat protein
VTATEKDLVARLVSALRHGSPDLRWRAALGLAALGPAATTAAGALIAALDDEDPLVRRVVANALVGVDWAAPRRRATLEAR